jgi:hypothetical protein
VAQVATKEAAARLAPLPRADTLNAKVAKLCDRGQDGDKEECTYVVPEWGRVDGVHSRTVTFNFINPVALNVEMLLDPTVSGEESYQWESTPYTGEYNELTTGNWWRYADMCSNVRELEDHDGIKRFYLMPLVFNTDGAAVDKRQTTSIKPMNIACGNLIGSVSRTARGKRCFGYWPKLDISKDANPTTACALKRHFNQWVIGNIVASVNKYKNGIRLRCLDGVERILVPAVPMMPSDWPEGQLQMNMKAGATSSLKNCRVCFRPTATFGDTQEGASYPRRTQPETEALVAEWAELNGRSATARRDVEKDCGTYLEPVGWWKAPLYTNAYGVHAMFPMDTLHTMSLGIIKGLKDVLVLHTTTRKERGALNERLTAMPMVRCTKSRGLYYKRFPHGILALGKMTGDDYIALLQQMPFAVGYSTAVIRNPVARAAFLKACTAARTILLVLGMKSVNENAARRMHAAAKTVGPLLQDAATGIDPHKVMTIHRPKVHAPIHFRYFIYRYGSGLNIDTGTFEGMQREVSHDVYAMDCNRKDGRDDRLLTMVNNRTVLRTVQERAVPDPALREPALYFYSPLHCSIGDVISTLSREWGGAVAAAEAILLDSPQLLHVDRDALYDFPVFGVCSVDHGADRTRYCAHPTYLKREPRYDFVSVAWEGHDPTPVRLVAFFGSSVQQPVGGELGDDGIEVEHDMYALVQEMTLLRSPPGDIGFPCYEMNPKQSDKSYQVVDVKSINGHARLVPESDHSITGVRFWIDDTLPELLRRDFLRRD